MRTIFNTNSANKLNVKIHWHDSPGFILGNREALSLFTGKKSYRMSSFYKNQRKEANENSLDFMKEEYPELVKLELPKKLE